MTSKEKAENLIDKYLMVRNEFNETLYFSEAKQCALIAVDELLNHCYEVMKPFWQEVKQEIEKL
jgi:hypothetical protein